MIFFSNPKIEKIMFFSGFVSKKKLPSISEVVAIFSFSTQIFTNGIGSPERLSLTTPRIWENVNCETAKKIQISLLSFIFILLSQKTEYFFYRYLILVVYFVLLIFLWIRSEERRVG